MNGLPTYEILESTLTGPRLVAEADGIEAARSAVVTLLFEHEASELEIVLGGRTVEVGTYVGGGSVEWLVYGRSRDLA